jgi:hypothetical protein
LAWSSSKFGRQQKAAHEFTRTGDTWSTLLNIGLNRPMLSSSRPLLKRWDIRVWMHSRTLVLSWLIIWSIF